MLVLIFVIAACFGASVARLEPLYCEPKGCDKMFKMDFNSPEDTMPNEEKLAEICPQIQEMLDCIIQQNSACLGQGIESLVLSDNETLSAMANILLGTSSLIEDLCDPKSRLHNEYVKSAQCLREVVAKSMTVGLCLLEAKGFFEGFRPDANENDEEGKCMVTAHAFACVSGEVQRECGETAQSVLVEIFKRIKVLKYFVCTPQMLQDLKTTYIEYLELESDRRNVFENAFDLRRRK